MVLWGTPGSLGDLMRTRRGWCRAITVRQSPPLPPPRRQARRRMRRTRAGEFHAQSQGMRSTAFAQSSPPRATRRAPGRVDAQRSSPSGRVSMRKVELTYTCGATGARTMSIGIPYRSSRQPGRAGCHLVRDRSTQRTTTSMRRDASSSRVGDSLRTRARREWGRLCGTARCHARSTRVGGMAGVRWASVRIGTQIAAARLEADSLARELAQACSSGSVAQVRPRARSIHCCSSRVRTTSIRTSCEARSISPRRSIRPRTQLADLGDPMRELAHDGVVLQRRPSDGRERGAEPRPPEPGRLERSQV